MPIIVASLLISVFTKPEKKEYSIFSRYFFVVTFSSCFPLSLSVSLLHACVCYMSACEYGWHVSGTKQIGQLHRFTNGSQAYSQLMVFSYGIQIGRKQLIITDKCLYFLQCHTPCHHRSQFIITHFAFSGACVPSAFLLPVAYTANAVSNTSRK